jgi:protein phosphatase
MIFHDVIGDIHGHSDELEVLLQKLGYLKLNGVYSHSVGSKKKKSR